jgi:phosphatidylserine decarboxylase
VSPVRRPEVLYVRSWRRKPPFFELLETVLKIPIHREGWRYIAVAVAINAALFAASLWVGIVFLPITIWCVLFFRDPERKTPHGKGLVISPADGKMLPLVYAVPPPELGLGDTPRARLSIFMDVFNVHVNRMPIDGRVIALNYRHGRFFNASFDKASEHNERMAIRIEPEENRDGSALAVIQIAGLIARRIKCDLFEGQKVRRGERFGIIRFGSRLDVYLPPDATVMVREKQHVRAGETVLAKLVTD